MSPGQYNDLNCRSNVPPFFKEADISIKTLGGICSQVPAKAKYPLSEIIEKNVPIYDGDRIREELINCKSEYELQQEWCRCLNEGPGVFVVHRAYPDERVIDSMTQVFREIILKEKSGGESKGDHFGSNERIWNSFQKSFICAPETAIDYYGNSILALASRSWLGPNYQITAQVNIVKPDGSAQSPHRDYHLGFQSDASIGEFPAHAQIMSQFLTLQGGIAHSDMPLDSGPTLFLPYSHQYPMGYMAFRKPEFVAYFDARKIQLPLRSGDAVFFNPALFHCAGANTSTRDRIGNLVQISSAFGRTMESIDHLAIVEASYPVLLNRWQPELMPEPEKNNVIAAVAEGYSFPTNLDSDPPLDGNAPQTMQQLLRIALEQQWTPECFKGALVEYAQRRKCVAD